MNVASFIAKRIAYNKQKSFSRFIIRLSTAATALSVATMIITVSFVTGFQKAISEKVFSFWGHLRIQQYEPNKALVAEETPIVPDDTVLQLLQATPEIAHYQAFATKSAVVEKHRDIEGVLIKGVDQNYDFQHLKPYLKSGTWIHFDTSQLYSRDIDLSQPVADELNVKAGDSVNIYFINGLQGTSIARKMHVAGIFKTGIDDYDKLFVIADLRLIQTVNGWENHEIGGYEVFLKDYHVMDSVSERLYNMLPDAWICRTVREIYPSMFDWLNILDMNSIVIFVVMTIVAVINLITCLLILVLERTKMIGVLKSLGSSDSLLQNIFLRYASIIAFRGISIGFLLGVGICLLQQYTGFIKLDESSYYIREAPVTIVWWEVFAICAGAFIVCVCALLLPTLFVRKVRPVKAINFN